MRLDVRSFCQLLAFSLGAVMSSAALAGTGIPFTVTFSEPVTVTGCPTNCPRLVLDVGGSTRYATYVSGNGTAALTFTYTAQAGDVDLDGITVSSNQIDLNTSGTVKDLNGNDLAPPSFSIPNTSGIKVDYPSLSMDMIANDYTLSGTHYASLTSFLTAASGSFTRASVGTYFDSSGVLQTASANTPRFDYDPVTHTAKGLLIEETRRNFLIDSDQFNSGSWTRSNITVTANAATAPNGTTSADKLIWNSATSTTYILQDSAITSGQTYTQSFFIKAGELGFAQIGSSNGFDSINTWATFNILTGTVGSHGSGGSYAIQAVGNSWYRISLTATATATLAGRFWLSILATDPGARLPVVTGNNTSGLYIWGAQLEQGLFPTSFIPTTTAAVTRQQDTLSLPTGGWLTAGTGTLMARGIAASGPRALGDQTLMALDNGAFDGRFVRFGRTSAKVSRGQISDTTTQFNTTSAAWGDTVDAKIALAYALNDFGLSFNGNAVLTGSSGTIPTLSRLIISGFGNDSGSLWSGTTKVIRYYPARVSNAQLQLLTQ